MDRNALLLYLQNVRDLEVARYKLQLLYDREKREVNERIGRLPTSIEPPKTKSPQKSVSAAVMGILFSFFALGYGIYNLIKSKSAGYITSYNSRGEAYVHKLGSSAHAMGILFIILGVVILLFFLFSYMLASEEKKECIEYNRKAKAHYNSMLSAVEGNKKEIVIIKDEWDAREKWLSQQYWKADELLNSLSDEYPGKALP